MKLIVLHNCHCHCHLLHEMGFLEIDSKHSEVNSLSVNLVTDTSRN